MNIETRITVSTTEDTIELTLHTVINDAVHEHTKKVLRLSDEIVRDALIQLGWTPPSHPADR